MAESHDDPAHEDIAIVGMAGRFPGARDIHELWSNLRAGVCSIRAFDGSELAAAGTDEPVRRDPNFVNAGAVMADADGFDADFFGMSPREAELTDPQHRVFLESVWEVLEHAGYDPETFDGRIALFGGVAPNTYFSQVISTHRELMSRSGPYPLMIATEREYAVTRTAFKLNLTGPAVSVGTACSTSAVAVHLACQSLLSGEADMAVAGGVRIRVPLTGGYIYEDGGILSPDGVCRAFDADARGTVPASGAAFVLLKRLSDAVADQDTVYALVKGSAINNDGSDKVGYTAPSVGGQSAVIAEALTMADVSADTIDYVEAHGTGTSLGDPIELAGLTRAFRLDTDGRGFCRLGSIKTNLGHLDAAAGVAGVIKTVLAMRAGEIPPSLNFSVPNPELDLSRSPFVVNDTLTTWAGGERPRRAGVSSFGLGGTNAHLVLEESPPVDRSRRSPAPTGSVLVLSARSDQALGHTARRLADFIAARPEIDLRDVAHTLQVGRRHFPHRRALVVADREAAVDALRSMRTDQLTSAAADHPRVAFMFPGGGSQHVDMARALYDNDRTFRTFLDECAELLMAQTGEDPRLGLFPEAAARESAVERLAQVRFALPALFAVEHSLARWWISRGVSPSSMIGHSLGEYVAACIAGVLSLDQALELVAARAALMQTAPEGAMLSVALGQADVAPYLSAAISIAAVNTPDSCVLAGRDADIGDLQERLAREDVDATRVRVRVASHSALMAPVLDAFATNVRAVSLEPPQIPFVSNVTGTWITDAQATDPDYWVNHLRSTVQFSDGLACVLEGSDVQLELGPGRTLCSFIRQHPSRTSRHFTVQLMRHPEHADDDMTCLLTAVGEAWAAGVAIDWTALADGWAGTRVGLPTYPFEHHRFWTEPKSTARVATQPAGRSAGADEPGPQAQSPSSMPSAARLPAASVLSRVDRIAARIVEILCELSGREPHEMDATTPFVDLGFDSLFLTQANIQFRKTFSVKITFRQLFEEAPTVAALASFIDAKLRPEDFPAPSPEHVPVDRSLPVTAEPAVAAGPDDGAALDRASMLERVVSEQLRVMAAQPQMLRRLDPDVGLPAAGGESAVAPPAMPKDNRSRPVASGAGAVPPSTATRAVSRTELNDRQRSALDQLIRRYGSLTPNSKRLSQKWRPWLADNRTIVGFDPLWKDLVYQIVANRSEGARIWDVDGNEYVDTAMCFGATLLGHSPAAVVDAVQEQVRRGFAVGVQSHLLGEVTEKILAMSGNDRLTYCHSGGEAVETAIRIARTVTGRDKVAYFTDDIHGRSDIVMGRGVGTSHATRTVPMVAGVPQHVVDDAVVLEYGSTEALEVIRARAGGLAAVLVEPVRTRNPDLQPVQFLKDMRALADQAGFLLLFDEVVTGFRVHQRGVQGLWDLRADLTMYGKVLGGGMPIGVVAGTADLVDAIDGGQWQFGDDSYPSGDITGSGGTMIKHPVSLAAAGAVLDHLKVAGPALQGDLTARTHALAGELNQYFDGAGIGIHVQQFGSFFRPTLAGTRRFEGLFQFFLREQGVHMNPPSPSFLSTAHSEEDVAIIIQAYKDAGSAMQLDGFLDERVVRRATSTRSADFVRSRTEIPILPNATRFLEGRGDSQLNHWNVGGLLESSEPLDIDALRAACSEVVRQHDALRLRYERTQDGPWRAFVVSRTEEPAFSTRDLSDLRPDQQDAALRQANEEAQAGFDITDGPLMRICHYDLGSRGHRLLVLMHHLVMDGLSWRPFWDDFLTAYGQATRHESVALPPVSSSFEVWARALARYAETKNAGADVSRWLELPWHGVRPIPLDLPAAAQHNTNASARTVTLSFSREETDRLLHGTPAVRQKIDLLITALARMLSQWTGSDTVLFDLMGHGRDEDLFDDVDLFSTVGFFISYTPVVLRLDAGERGSSLLSEQIHACLRHGFAFDVLRTMSPDGEVRKTLSRLPRADVLFNYLGRRSRLDTVPEGTELRLAADPAGATHGPRGLRYYPLSVSAEVWESCLRLTFVYSEHLHERSKIEELVAHYRTSLVELIEGSTRVAFDTAAPLAGGDSTQPLPQPDERWAGVGRRASVVGSRPRSSRRAGSSS